MSDRTEFIEAAKAHAFAYRERMIIHCMGSFTGADWDPGGVISAIEAAKSVRWVKNVCDHELEVEQADGRVWRFDVRRPQKARPTE